MRPITIRQGVDKAIDVEMNDDLTAATEIEFRIDTPTQVVKTLTGGHITGVTAAQFTVQIDAADTETVEAAPYKYQAQATIAGKIYPIRFTPNKIQVIDSIFVDCRTSGDYGS